MARVLLQIPSGTPSFPTTYQPTSRKLLESESSSDRALHGSIALIRNVFEVDVLAEHLGHECVPRGVEFLLVNFERAKNAIPVIQSNDVGLTGSPCLLKKLCQFRSTTHGEA